MDKNNISIILPTLNEKKNLESLIPSIIDMLKNNYLNFEYEILVVDDLIYNYSNKFNNFDIKYSDQYIEDINSWIWLYWCSNWRSLRGAWA